MFDYKYNDIVKGAVYSIIRKQHSLTADLLSDDITREIAIYGLKCFIEGINGALTIDEMDGVFMALEQLGTSQADFRYISGVYGDKIDYLKFTSNQLCNLNI